MEVNETGKNTCIMQSIVINCFYYISFHFDVRSLLNRNKCYFKMKMQHGRPSDHKLKESKHFVSSTYSLVNLCFRCFHFARFYFASSPLNANNHFFSVHNFFFHCFTFAVMTHIDPQWTIRTWRAKRSTRIDQKKWNGKVERKVERMNEMKTSDNRESGQFDHWK